MIDLLTITPESWAQECGVAFQFQKIFSWIRQRNDALMGCSFLVEESVEFPFRKKLAKFCTTTGVVNFRFSASRSHDERSAHDQHKWRPITGGAAGTAHTASSQTLLHASCTSQVLHFHTGARRAQPKAVRLGHPHGVMYVSSQLSLSSHQAGTLLQAGPPSPTSNPT